MAKNHTVAILIGKNSLLMINKLEPSQPRNPRNASQPREERLPRNASQPRNPRNPSHPRAKQLDQVRVCLRDFKIMEWFLVAILIVTAVFLIVPLVLIFGGFEIKMIRNILIKFGLMTGIIRMKNRDEDLR